MVMAATRQHLSGGTVVVVLAVLAVIWLVRLWWHPFGACGRCDGSGKNLGSTGKRYGHCRKCKGTGRRQRLGSKQVQRAVRGLRSARTNRKD